MSTVTDTATHITTDDSTLPTSPPATAGKDGTSAPTWALWALVALVLIAMLLGGKALYASSNTGTEIAALDTRLTTAEGVGTAIDTRLAKAERAHNALDTKVAGMDTRLTANEEAIVGLDTRLTTVRDGLDGRLTTVEETIADIAPRLTEVERKNKATQVTIGRLRRQMVAQNAAPAPTPVAVVTETTPAVEVADDTVVAAPAAAPVAVTAVAPSLELTVIGN